MLLEAALWFEFKVLATWCFLQLSEMWSKLESAKKSLVHVESQFDLSKSPTFPEGNRPTHKTGLFGLWGQKVDSIDFYNEQIKELAPQVATEQCRTLEEEQKAAAFVFFNNRRAAAEASQVRQIFNHPLTWGSLFVFWLTWI